MGDFFSNLADVVHIGGGYRFQLDDPIEPHRATANVHVGGTSNWRGPGLTFGLDGGIDSAGEGRVGARVGFGGPLHLILWGDIAAQAGAHLQDTQTGFQAGAYTGVVGRLLALTPVGLIGLQGEVNAGNLGNGDAQFEFGVQLIWGTSFSLWL